MLTATEHLASGGMASAEADGQTTAVAAYAARVAASMPALTPRQTAGIAALFGEVLADAQQS